MQETQDRRPIEPELEFDSGLDIDPEDLQPRAWSPPRRNRVLLVIAVLATIVLMVVLPPLISVNRYRRQIAGSIGASLGRPVHMGSVTLNVLPLPGLTLENLVVSEDPAFGSEPVIQARSVQARLRVRSLWRRRVEFTRISLTDASINLVHRADGRWNFESILLQAAKIDAAPTAQPGAGVAPRFPYIEATGARVNVKMGLEKMPVALTDAELALWLPQPQQWRLRLEGHPTRTDAAPTDTGTLRVQGILGRAAILRDMPIDLSGEWGAAPLGGVSWMLMGRDAGFRGEMTLRTSLRGTVGQSALESRLELRDVRRADFVPQHMLSLDAVCRAQAAEAFHRLDEVRCGWPGAALEDPKAAGLTVRGSVPEVSRLQSASAEAAIAHVAAGGLLDAMRIGTTRISPELTTRGSISGSLTCCSGSVNPAAKPWLKAAGSFTVAEAKLAVGPGKPFLDDDVTGDLADGELTLQPVKLNHGAPQAAELEGRVSLDGYTLHLSGPLLRTRLMLLAQALPQFGDALEQALPPVAEAGPVDAPIRVDLVSNRIWIGGQKWTAVAAKAVKKKRAKHHSKL